MSSDPYYADEFFDDDESAYYERWHEDDEPDETSFRSYIGKAKNGHLYTQDVWGWKYAEQDWGETVGQWQEQTYRLSEIFPLIAKLAVEIGRDMKPGEKQEFAWWNYLDEDEVYAQADDDIPF